MLPHPSTAKMRPAVDNKRLHRLSFASLAKMQVPLPTLQRHYRPSSRSPVLACTMVKKNCFGRSCTTVENSSKTVFSHAWTDSIYFSRHDEPRPQIQHRRRQATGVRDRVHRCSQNQRHAHESARRVQALFDYYVSKINNKFRAAIMHSNNTNDVVTIINLPVITAAQVLYILKLNRPETTTSGYG